MFVDFVVVVVVNVVVVALFVVADHIIFSWSINVNLRLLKATVEFLWWWVGWGGVDWLGCAKSFCVQPNFCVEVVLCCWGCDNSTSLFAAVSCMTKINYS